MRRAELDVQFDLFQRPERLTERRIALLGAHEVPYLLKRSVKRRRMLLTVDENGLTVSVPWRTGEQRIADLLRQSTPWVLSKLELYAARRPRERRWAHGETIEYLGRGVPLHLNAHNGRTVAQLQGDGSLRLWLTAPEDPGAVRAAVIAWYRRHALPHLSAVALRFAALLGEHPPTVLLSSAQGRWGSCNARREVRLNWRLMQAPPRLIDYVAAHEVAHLRVMNHSTRFWSTVERLLPDYREARAELDRRAAHYMTL